MDQQPATSNQQPADLDKTKKMATIAYYLNLASLLLGVTSIVAIAIAYVYRSDAKGTYLESHCTWIIRTFWICFLFGMISFPLIFLLGIGFITMLATGILFLVRTIMGLKELDKGNPIQNPQSWLI